MKFTPWRALLMVLDVAVVAVAVLLAATLTANGSIPAETWQQLPQAIAAAAIAVVLANLALGLYNRVWEYASVETAISVAVAVTLGLSVAAVATWLAGGTLPLSIWYSTWLTCLVVLGGTRLAWRGIRRAALRNGSQPRRVLIYGAGQSGCALPRAWENAKAGFQLVGYVDDDPEKQGLYIGQARVLGTGQDIKRLARRHRVDLVIIAIPSTTRERVREAYLACREAGVEAKALPPFLELFEETQPGPREVRVEDLLGRELPLTSIELHQDYIRDQTVLVTGAGGSIGAELSRQVCRYAPRRVLLLGRGENRIHWAYLYLRQRHPEIEIIPLVHNITVESSMREVFATYRPTVVFHTAAHKHVYLMEKVPAEAVRNNVLGTRLLARLAEEYKVQRFIFISTDKAVAPTSVMGQTKRVCELLLTMRPQRGTRFVCVRFGNVLGSEGSVLEIFKRQWQRREPLTVTHPDATRYFMTIPEACFLVLQAGAIGEHANIYLLDMGKPVSIMQLAQEFILLSGGNPHAAGAIKITGLLPGEKLHEVLVSEGEELLPTGDGHISRVNNHRVRVSVEELQEYLTELAAGVEREDHGLALRLLKRLTHPGTNDVEDAPTIKIRPTPLER